MPNQKPWRRQRRKQRKKRISLQRFPPPHAERPDERWRLDFLTDSLVDGRRFRVMTIVDNVSRVSPAIAVDVSIKGERVVAVLDQLKRPVGLPQRIASDNAPEFISNLTDGALTGVVAACGLDPASSAVQATAAGALASPSFDLTI